MHRERKGIIGLKRLWFIVVLLAGSWLALGAANEADRKAVLLEIDGPIGPAVADYFHRGLERAQSRQAAIVVVRMDTPGGLDLSMRTIIQDILSSTVPVAVYVSPSGARAASAGTYILYASHIAVMAPATNLGAATPVRIGGVPNPMEDKQPKGDKDEEKKDHAAKPADAMEKKILNDAIAYIRGLAQMRGRNEEWAEQAVREAASLPAQEAVKLRVVDFVAQDVSELLRKANGRKVSVAGNEVVLRTEGLVVERIDPDWRSRLLAVITDPNVAYILMLLGIYGLFFELWNPGFVLPGVLGGICLLLALFAFQVLPINYAGLGLILLGIAFMVAEAFAPSFGALGIGGVVAFSVGSIMLMDTDVEGYTIAWPLIATVTVTTALFFIGVVMLVLKARQRSVVSGREEMIGDTGEALESFKTDGRVRIHSEDWNARSRVPVERGQKVKVTAMEGLVLLIEPLEMEDS